MLAGFSNWLAVEMGATHLGASRERARRAHAARGAATATVASVARVATAVCATTWAAAPESPISKRRPSTRTSVN